jgi:integrase
MDLTDAQRVDAVTALAILGPHRVSLTAAANAFHERAKLMSGTVPFSALRVEMVQRKKKDGKSTRHLDDLRFRMSTFGRTFDSRPVAGIETREIDDWLSNLKLSLTSRFNYRKVLRNAFQFAISRGYANVNPVIGTGQVKAGELVPGVFTPIEISALLALADSRIVSSLALSAFAGLRDAEVGKITWEMVDLEGGFIKVDAGIAKTASRRLIPILPNLRSWLTPHTRKAGLIRPSHRTAYALRKLAAKKAAERLAVWGQPHAGLTKWPNNGLRHSFVSYRLAVVSNSAQVAEECGNSVGILKKNYLQLVTPEEGAKWFAVVPAKKP